MFPQLLYSMYTGPRLLRSAVQYLQGLATNGTQGFHGAGYTIRCLPGGEVVAVLRKGLNGEVGCSGSRRRCLFGVPVPGNECFMFFSLCYAYVH